MPPPPPQAAPSPSSQSSPPAVARSASAAAARACRVPPQATELQLAALVQRNCDKVRSTVGDFERVLADDEDTLFWLQLWTKGLQAKEAAQKEAWRRQSAAATEMCDEAMGALADHALGGVETADLANRTLGGVEAAGLAVNAWGSVIMGGQECCTLFVPPYCTYTTLSFSTILLACPFCTLCCMFVGSLLLRAWRDRCGFRKQMPSPQLPRTGSMTSALGLPPAGSLASEVEAGGACGAGLRRPSSGLSHGSFQAAPEAAPNASEAPAAAASQLAEDAAESGLAAQADELASPPVSQKPSMTSASGQPLAGSLSSGVQSAARSTGLGRPSSGAAADAAAMDAFAAPPDAAASELVEHAAESGHGVQGEELASPPVSRKPSVTSGLDPPLAGSLATEVDSAARGAGLRGLFGILSCGSFQAAAAAALDAFAAPPAVAASEPAEHAAETGLGVQGDELPSPPVSQKASMTSAPGPPPAGSLDSEVESAAIAAGVRRLLSGLAHGSFQAAAAGVALDASAAPQAAAAGELAEHGAESFLGVQGEELLRRELKAAWTERSCLRVLPQAEEFAEATAHILADLQAKFDFQVDSVRNQHEHLLSLWHSHCSMVADRALEEHDSSADVEGDLLQRALREMHAELLEGYLRWRAKLRAYELDTLAGGASAGVAAQAPAGGTDGTEKELVEEEVAAEKMLEEVATYLLVWGEAGNVRFMPELVYFITELALSSPAGTLRELYPSIRAAPAAGGSNRFLAAIVRPIYKKIFSEWYTRVSVDGGNGKDSKKLKSGYENFLPPDVANYDDWNELFCDPHRLAQGLMCRDGSGTWRLFTKRRWERFAALSCVDWEASLAAEVVKTHREVHSWWAVFGATHRVWLLHGVLFAVALVAATGEPPARSDGGEALGGQTPWVRFAAPGLLSPAHALLLTVARWQVRGSAAATRKGVRWLGTAVLKFALFATPVGTYAGARWMHYHRHVRQRNGLLAAHYCISCLGLLKLLLVPSTSERYRIWSLTPVPLRTRALRYLFWVPVLVGKCYFAVVIFGSVHEAMVELGLAMPGRQSASDVRELLYNPTWGANVLLWALMWVGTFFLFLSDTQLWFTAACTVLGVATTIAQRGGCKVLPSYMLEDAVALIPERFSKKVLPWRTAKDAPFSELFPDVWDRILQYMRYEDKVDSDLQGNLSFNVRDAGQHRAWGEVSRSVGLPRGQVEVPDLFRQRPSCERCFRWACVRDPDWPSNPDAQWRIMALARGLGLEMPRPFRAPHVPGLTVLIPHYGESILLTTEELYQRDQARKPLIHWLHNQYEAEFRAFTARMQARREQDWPATGSSWDAYEPAQWSKITPWASMRMQTLWRTVAGMCLYHPALQYHFEVQGDRRSRLAGHWTPSDSFTCLVSMQMYKFFNATQLEHTNQMFGKFPDCLKVAYIDHIDVPRAADPSDCAAKQKRRYFSCLVDKNCQLEPDGRRTPKFKVELPGYPILGDGKGDNQNHAIPFMRGQLAQCIDANQGAYFEQMLLLPSALGEFRTRGGGGDGAGGKRIVGFPEHITSDIGSVGDLAASAELAFGSILQRSFSVLGARMHYGHPDIMSKAYMMQQGGVSKATKTLNLSEDIFAGMDFTLRGQGRTIHHCEYFHLAKGRDLGFNTVLGFFSKLSSGTGEQVISRQTHRLGQVMHLPEALAFYYGHGGYYLAQFLVASVSMPLLCYLWLLAILSGCEQSFSAVQGCGGGGARAASSAGIMADLMGVWFSWILVLFLLTTSLPLVTELLMQRSPCYALRRYFEQLLTLSPLLFLFQGKTIGYYVVNELRFGGATYVSTGRGLPTDRRPFIGELAEDGRTLKTVGGLYLDYAVIAYYDGAVLCVATILVAMVGGVGSPAAAGLGFVWFSFGITIASWLWAPFVYNPYQFQAAGFRRDVRCIVAFFWEDGGRHWVKWYDKTQLRLGSGRPAVDSTFFIAACLAMVWYAMMNVKAEALGRIYSEFHQGQVSFNVLILLPPVLLSLLSCALVVLLGGLGRCLGALRRRAQALATPPSSPQGAAGADDLEQPPPAVHPEDAPVVPHQRRLDYDVRPRRASSSTSTLAAAAAAPAATTRPSPPPADGPEEGGGYRGRACLPLGAVALGALLLDVAEAGACLYQLLLVGWWKAFIAGLILKWALNCGLVHLGEGLLRLLERPAPAWAPLFLRVAAHHTLFLWVRAHRMARDLLTSSLILAGLFPLVLLDKMNDCLCPGVSIHHLLIYRSPNHLGRREAHVRVAAAPAGGAAAAEAPAAGAGAGAAASSAAAGAGGASGPAPAAAQVPAPAPPVASAAADDPPAVGKEADPRAAAGAAPGAKAAPGAPAADPAAAEAEPAPARMKAEEEEVLASAEPAPAHSEAAPADEPAAARRAPAFAATADDDACLRI